MWIKVNSKVEEMMEVAHNISHINHIFNNSNYSVDTYLQDLEQMVALESNTDFNRRTNKVRKLK